MRARVAFVLGVALAGSAGAQEVVRFDEILAADRPEAWAMQYLASSTVPAAYAPGPGLEVGEFELAVELAHVPSLSDAQRRVGFEGTKVENLNTAPVFGRVRASVGLPAHWRLEAGWTPPLTLDGATPHALFALAIGRRWWTSGPWSLDARAFGQRGSVTGDFTCPEEIVGATDPEVNPFGCEAPSHDRFRLRQYGLEATLAWTHGPLRVHAGAGALRNELVVDVDALTYGVNDRSQLVAHHRRPFFALGVGRALGARWRVEAGWLHVPLPVRRDGERERDDFGALRVALAWRPGAD